MRPGRLRLNAQTCLGRQEHGPPEDVGYGANFWGDLLQEGLGVRIPGGCVRRRLWGDRSWQLAAPSPRPPPRGRSAFRHPLEHSAPT